MASAGSVSSVASIRSESEIHGSCDVYHAVCARLQWLRECREHEEALEKRYNAEKMRGDKSCQLYHLTFPPFVATKSDTHDDDDVQTSSPHAATKASVARYYGDWLTNEWPSWYWWMLHFICFRRDEPSSSKSYSADDTDNKVDRERCIKLIIAHVPCFYPCMAHGMSLFLQTRPRALEQDVDRHRSAAHVPADSKALVMGTDVANKWSAEKWWPWSVEFHHQVNASRVSGAGVTKSIHEWTSEWTDRFTLAMLCREDAHAVPDSALEREKWYYKYWAFIHLICAVVSDTKQAKLRKDTTGVLLRQLLMDLPCVCRTSAMRCYLEFPFPMWDATREQYRSDPWIWSIHFHNRHNKHLKKPVVEIAQATRYWNHIFFGSASSCSSSS